MARCRRATDGRVAPAGFDPIPFKSGGCFRSLPTKIVTHPRGHPHRSCLQPPAPSSLPGDLQPMKVNARKRSEAPKIRLPESAHRGSNGDSDSLSPQPHVTSVHVPITGVPVNAPKTAPVQMMESDPEEKEGWKKERERAFVIFPPVSLCVQAYVQVRRRCWLLSTQ